MNTCASYLWGDIMKVTAYPDSDITFSYPMNVYSKVISESGEGVTGPTYSIKSSANPIVLSISDMSAKLKDDYKVSVAGGSHTVKLEYSMECNGNNIAPYNNELTSLEALGSVRNYHLIIEYIGGNRHLVRSTRDGYQFSWNISESGTTSCSLSIHCVSGPQKIL